MAVTTVSIQLALKKIIENSSEVRPQVLPIKLPSNPQERVFFVTMPPECKAKVCAYLSRHLGMHHPVDPHPLVLSSREASWLVELVLKEDTGESLRHEHRRSADRIGRS